MSIQINKNSRLVFHTPTIIDGVEFWGFNYEPVIDKDVLDDKYPKKDIEYLDGVARLYYKSEVLWWVIAKVNQIFDIFEDMDLYDVEWTENVYGTDGVATGETIGKVRNFTGLLNAQLFIEDLKNKGIEANLITKTMVLNVPMANRVFTELL